MTQTSDTEAAAESKLEHDYPRLDLVSVHGFPKDYLVDPGTPVSDDEQIPPFSLQGRIKFLERLERELKAAWRSGHAFLTVPGWRSVEGPYPGEVVKAQFVPHDDPDRFDGPSGEHSVTYPVQEIADRTHYYRSGGGRSDSCTNLR
ncbi:hypothetical protein C497_03875 [Halalkalicoccus jeotgali B3]|uniref:Uncharacterized protein n=1 Tax=Halalkalicoccus jeotgali (strain DSM 18796 / CECT 7217 / JCM 14584 / KCTC 4019 / B3) TaxID=795797 RepID=D8J9W9_HALJB|nr:hypothetical protein HacjB3_05500 [Halalkalicoccus jeotgali B3]ELY40205.1 hypothetical protein C497_03875 [Halalkalicoccus jeotgali B3]